MADYKPILCLDFDGVLHSYASGWKGAEVIPDPPVPGAIAFLREAVRHFRVAVFSSRSHQEGGGAAMRTWLGGYIMAEEPDIFMQDPPWFAAIEWPMEKPAAMVTIDDRAVTFDGTWPTMDWLLAFAPWNKKVSGAGDPPVAPKPERIWCAVRNSDAHIDRDTLHAKVTTQVCAFTNERAANEWAAAQTTVWSIVAVDLDPPIEVG